MKLIVESGATKTDWVAVFPDKEPEGMWTDHKKQQKELEKLYEKKMKERNKLEQYKYEKHKHEKYKSENRKNEKHKNEKRKK